MMKKILLILLCLPIIGFGQSWEFAYDQLYIDAGIDAQQTIDGGYIVLGNAKNSAGLSQSHITLLKVNENGTEEWSKLYTTILGNTNIVAGGIDQTLDGGYIITGTALDSLKSLLIKTDSLGNILWLKNYSITSRSYSIKQTNDQGYIFSGSSFNKVSVTKTDGMGLILWSDTFSITGISSGSCIQQTNDGGYIIAGITESSNIGNITSFILKIDSLGNFEWQELLNLYWNEGGYVEQTNDGGYIITGWAENTSGQQLGMNTYLVKFDSTGVILWTKIFNGSASETGSQVQQTNDGGYAIIGTTTPNTTNSPSKVLLIKTDDYGNTEWRQEFSIYTSSGGSSLKQTNDGGFIICGTTRPILNWTSSADIYLIKTDDQGNITSTFNIPITNNSNGKLIKTVDLLGRESKRNNNTPLFYIYDDGTVEKRIVIE